VSVPLVTISCAFHNERTRVLDMIRSILAQTFTDWELVLIDDGSTDGSADVVTRVRDARIRVYRNPVNRGLAYSLNRITRMAEGKYLARMDADDLSMPKRLEVQLAWLTKNPDIDLVGSGAVVLDPENRIRGCVKGTRGHAHICARPWNGFPLTHGSIVGKRTWFQRFPYDERMVRAQDYGMYLRAYKESVFDNIEEPLYFYRCNKLVLHRQLKSRFHLSRYSMKYFLKNRQYWNAVRGTLFPYAKFLVEVFYVCVHREERLLLSRYGGISCHEKCLYQDIIRKILEVKIPDRD
jgi:glycosyltransferase involved in cell wall biosynthesis